MSNVDPQSTAPTEALPNVIDLAAIPNPGEPMADGYFEETVQKMLTAMGILTPEAFAERYGVALDTLTPFQRLWIVAPEQAAHELELNRLYQEGRNRRGT